LAANLQFEVKQTTKRITTERPVFSLETASHDN